MKNIIKDDNGAVMVEYALLMFLVTLVSITGLGLVGQSVSSTFSTINATMPHRI